MSSRAPARREFVYGRNPVREALRSGRRKVHALLVARGTEERGALEQILGLALAAGVSVERPDRGRLDRIHRNHQGVAASVDPYPYVDLGDILERAREGAEPALVLLLDVIQDPQNFGTLLRAAEAVGVHGVVIPPRRGVGVTPAVVSASSGASEHLFVAVENLASAIDVLKRAEVWIYGLENTPEARPISEVDFRGAAGLVVGHEGRGMRRLVREACDVLVRIPMRGRIESLNAATAGSIALYAIWEARGFN